MPGNEQMQLFLGYVCLNAIIKYLIKIVIGRPNF